MSKQNQTEQKQHWKTYFDYKYLGGHDLYGKGDLVVTPECFYHEEVIGEKGKKDQCLVFKFTDPNLKTMIINKTNCATLEHLHGGESPADWMGKPMQLYVKKGVRCGANMTNPLRIRDFKPQVTINTKPAIDALKAAEDMDKLKDIFMGLPNDVKSDHGVVAAKDARKVELESAK